MGRHRSTMHVVAECLKKQTKPLSSTAIAQLCDLSIQQTKDALKVLSSKDEIQRCKDPATNRGLLYLASRPPAYKFVDPELFKSMKLAEPRACPVVWMSQQLSFETQKDFSTLKFERKNASRIFKEFGNAEAV
jgi:hypothetical protein